jgi:hypothetical protein
MSAKDHIAAVSGGLASWMRVGEDGRQEIDTARQRMFHPRLQYAKTLTSGTTHLSLSISTISRSKVM